MLTIIADENIPFLQQLFGQHELVRFSSPPISPQILNKADALMVRTVTQVDQNLLKNSSIKFVGSMTAGTNHVDLDYLSQRKIHFASAPGANAQAVADYVIAVVAWLQYHRKLKPLNFSAGIIGVGHVGTLVQASLEKIGAKVLVNDPPRAIRDPSFLSTPLEQFQDLDLITLHTSLNDSTYKFIDSRLFSQQKNCVLINTARGELINTSDLIAAQSISACHDVYANEPNIDTETIEPSLIATPHIAGYSLQAKYRATQMVCHQFNRYFGLHDNPAKIKKNRIELDASAAKNWQECVLLAYNPGIDSNRFKHDLKHANAISASFLRQRNQYRLRTELQNIMLKNCRLNSDDQERLHHLNLI